MLTSSLFSTEVPRSSFTRNRRSSTRPLILSCCLIMLFKASRSSFSVTEPPDISISRPVLITVRGVWNSCPASMKKSRLASSSFTFSVRSCSTIILPLARVSVVISSFEAAARVRLTSLVPSLSSNIEHSSSEGSMTSTESPLAGSLPCLPHIFEAALFMYRTFLASSIRMMPTGRAPTRAASSSFLSCASLTLSFSESDIEFRAFERFCICGSLVIGKRAVPPAAIVSADPLSRSSGLVTKCSIRYEPKSTTRSMSSSEYRNGLAIEAARLFSSSRGYESLITSP